MGALEIPHTVRSIKKRNGVSVDFRSHKILRAIQKAVLCTGEMDDDRMIFLTKQVVREIDNNYRQPTVEDVQDVVEKVLMNNGHVATAKAYILYRERRKEVREERQRILDGLSTDLKLSFNTLLLLKERYLLRADGRVIETPEEMFHRVAHALARVDTQYGQDSRPTEEQFYRVLSELLFLPNSPALMNGGTARPQLFASYAVPIDDSIQSIGNALTAQALIQQSGGGTGFDFSKIRPSGDAVAGMDGVAAGPVKFMKIFNTVAETILQNGRRKGANMGVLRIDHPDILAFITLKQDGVALNNFNISVGLTEDFMEAVQKDDDFSLIHPRTGEPVQRLKARHIFDLLILNAWRTGDPGILFLDRMNYSRSNPLGLRIDTTGPCGEQPLYGFEGAVLGSVNVGRLVSEGSVDYELLRETVRIAIHFLDNCIDLNHYPLSECEMVSKGLRRIGLGLMGFADLLFQLGIPYDSEEAVATARSVMKCISEEADRASQTLAQLRGAFPLFTKSIYQHGRVLRNATRTTISPTGSISLIADASPSFDPVVALSYTKRVLNKEILIVNSHFENAMQKYKVYSEELMKKVANAVSIQRLDEIPSQVRRVFKVGHDISPEWQVRMQAAFQDSTDNAISKTVNFPSWVSTRDVERVFFLAYNNGCKGITIYRDKSKENQVISVNLDAHKNNVETVVDELAYCPVCQTRLEDRESMLTCKECGFSRCRV